MPRLPVVGSDDGAWGTVLNDFLAVSLNADGTIKDGTVAQATLTSGLATIVTAHRQTLPYSDGSAELAVDAGTMRLYNDTTSAWTILSVRATVGIVPTGSSIIVDVNVDGTTIFTTQGNRPTIAASGTTSGKVTNMNVTTVAASSYLTVDIDQVGSTIAGGELVVQIEVA